MDRDLERYFRDHLANNKIDFKLRVQQVADGRLYFYLYPEGGGGGTNDYFVKGNQLKPRFHYDEDYGAWVADE